LAHEKLKNKEEAGNSFKGLYAYANREQKFEGNTQFSIRVSEEQWRANNLYANGLYQLAKENKEEAKKYFEKAVETNPHVWASFWLEEEF
jgi:TPR repeat protein